MRHKQRPVKSSRHKSVTFIIDSPHTSFGDHNESTSNHQSSFEQTNINQHHQHHKTRQPVLANSSPRSQRSTHYGGSATSGAAQQSAIGLYRTPTNQRAVDIETNNEPQPLMRKQFEHNFGHMSDVMRLAFLENNDISIDDCSNIDFNSLSTASILQRNIQQQLQQERRDLLHMRQQQQQQQQQQQLQQPHLHQQQMHPQAIGRNQLYVQDLLDDYGIDDEYDDISDSRIFATATPTTSSNSMIATNSYQQDVHRPGAANAKRRTKETNPRVAMLSPEDQGEVSTRDYGKGFYCDEPNCGKSFPSLRKLRHHKVVHSDEFPFVCEFKGCAKKFKRKFGIDLHSTTHFDLDPAMYSKTSNNSSLPFFGRRMQYSMCKPCGQKFKTVHEYQYHMLKHGKEPFKCPVKGCGQTFGIWKSFQKHRASHYFNYYCKMDPRCDHHTSNLQLLKLHIYCCHFRRKLPENASLMSKDQEADDLAEPDEPIELAHSTSEVFSTKKGQKQEEAEEEGEDSIDVTDDSRRSSTQTPRRDSRLRKNPPRSSTFAHQDYASINNGSSFIRPTPSTPQSKKTRSATKQQPPQPPLENEISDEFGNDPDYGMSDSGIFATATSTTNPNSINVTHSSQKDVNRLVNAHAKKRTKETNPRVAVSSPVKQEISPQDYGEGFYCDEPNCGKSFPSLRKLRHHKVVHSDEFPFVCEFKGCAKKFKRKFGIDLHSTTHFDLDPAMYSKTSNNSSLPFFGRRMQYSMCKPCGQKFKTVHEYQYHMLKHGKEPFKCPVKGCGQTFGIWKSFQKHRASHYFNYYCKMDPRCDHHTSNLQLLKLHIYCCHFRRKLPENASLMSKDQEPEEVEDVDGSAEPDESIEEPCDNEQYAIKIETNQDEEGEDSIDVTDDSRKSSTQTPRRDSRLRKNPPRSSTFGHQDYASINNGSSFVKALSSTPASKRTRAAGGSQSSGSQSGPPPEKKIKLPMKVLPKRSAQRLPMSLIAGTEDEQHGSEVGSVQDHKVDDDKEVNSKEDEDGAEHDPTKRNRFKCNLCDYHFSVKFQLTKHLSTHLDLTPDMYSKTADKQVVELSELRRREFQCDKCKIKYDQMSDLDEHMQKKHGQRPYVCNFCQMPSTFSMAKQYLSHLYEHRFIYRCTMEPDCDFTINRKDALKLHIFRMHLNQQLPTYLEEMAHIFDRI